MKKTSISHSNLFVKEIYIHEFFFHEKEMEEGGSLTMKNSA